MGKKLFIVETDSVPEPIKTALEPFVVQYGNLVESSNCDFVTEYRNSTGNFLEFVISFFELDELEKIDVYQMKVSRKGITKVNEVDLGASVNRIMSSIIVRKDIYYMLGEKKWKVLSAQQTYQATEIQIRYLIKELSLSKLREDSGLAKSYSEKLIELSNLSKWKPDEKYLEAVKESNLDAHIKTINVKKGRLASDIEKNLTWKSIFKSIALKIGLIRIYRNSRKK